ncbi:MAG TPA: hypothetical protein VNZ52_15365 [Candidatus Thermoplasmatota archaeon]|nr:hypothetical protein [Candidatus Thermoplasmatota archaeon]
MPTAVPRLVPLALAVLLAIALPALAQDSPVDDVLGEAGNATGNTTAPAPAGTPSAPEVSLAVQDAEGITTEKMDAGSVANLVVAFTQSDSPMQVQLWAIASVDGKEVWDHKSEYALSNPDEPVMFKVPLSELAPGEYLLRAYLIDDAGNVLDTQGTTRLTVEGSALPPIVDPGFPWLTIIGIGAVLTTAAGLGLGLYDSSLASKKKALLPDTVILVTGLVGGLLGLLVAFKVTKHPERSNVEMITWILLGAQGFLLAIIVWLAL